MAGGVSFVVYGSRAGPTETLSSAELYTPAVLAGAPVLLSLSGDGKGQGAILHAGTHQIVSSSNSASVGEQLEIYLTGLTDGSVIPPQVAIGSRMAEIFVFWQSSIRGEPGECPRAKRRCYRRYRLCALDLPWPPEQ